MNRSTDWPPLSVLIETMSPTQHFHTISYGICAHEDMRAHKYVLKQVIDAVNKVVHERAVAKQGV